MYWKAYEQGAAPMKGKLDQLGIEMTPALYAVAFEYRFSLGAKSNQPEVFSITSKSRLTGYFPVGNTRFASHTYVPYQIIGNHETTAKVHGEHKGVCFPGVG
jgi:hypothetical protein